ncbi:hypothetical protein AAHE18_20G270700 [Arachis hypogaea]|nr:uncharacterized protein DS421_13g440240 [Arachis hypogaea]
MEANLENESLFKSEELLMEICSQWPSSYDKNSSKDPHVSHVYPRCRTYLEIALHALLFCPVSSAVWDKTQLVSFISTNPNLQPWEWCLKLITQINLNIQMKNEISKLSLPTFYGVYG